MALNNPAFSRNAAFSGQGRRAPLHRTCRPSSSQEMYAPSRLDACPTAV